MAVDEAVSPTAAGAGAGSAGHGAAASFTPTTGGWAGRLAFAAVPIFLVLIFPLLRPAADVRIYTTGVIYAVIALSLNVLLGYTGQISLGHQAFVGVGAFTSAYIVTQQGQSFFLAVVVAMAVGGIQALILGAVSLRVRGLYFALVTLSYGAMAEHSLFQIESLTGGQAGQPAPQPAGFDTPHRYYFLCVAFLAAVLWVDSRMMKTKGGRALLALRENPRVASTLGINVKLYTLFAFVVAGMFAGLGGALFAHNGGFVVSVVFDFRLALVFVLMTVVGGLRSRPGLVIGGAFFALLPYLVEKTHLEVVLAKLPFVPDLSAQIAPLVIGPLLLLTTLTGYPGGIGQQVRPVIIWMRGGRFDMHAAAEKEVQISDVRA